jgi:hypothetical protein
MARSGTESIRQGELVFYQSEAVRQVRDKQRELQKLREQLTPPYIAFFSRPSYSMSERRSQRRFSKFEEDVDDALGHLGVEPQRRRDVISIEDPLAGVPLRRTVTLFGFGPSRFNLISKARSILRKVVQRLVKYVIPVGDFVKHIRQDIGRFKPACSTVTITGWIGLMGKQMVVEKTFILSFGEFTKGDCEELIVRIGE